MTQNRVSKNLESESPATEGPTRPLTVPGVALMKQRGQRIAMLTAYDATFARMLDEAGVDILLVGDSLGMVVQGLDSTLPVTVDEVIYHCRAVARGTRRALVVGDMPFMSYQADPMRAVENAGRFLKDGGAHAVKLEGGQEMADTVRRIVACGIPVMGHVGLTPQHVRAMGGFRVQGRTQAAADRLVDDVLALEEAGAFAVVLEGIPSRVASRIHQATGIPTIGIGAGPDCDGQVLVCYDLFGLTPDLRPRFVKRYAEFFEAGVACAGQYVDEVRRGEFPTEAHSFHERGASGGESSGESGEHASVRPAVAYGATEP